MTGEAPLLPRVAQGDAQAVPLLMDRFGPLVWSIARKQLRPDEAEDVVQEIFIQLWKSAGSYDPERASEAAFITTIARRRLIDHRRRVGRRPRSEDLPEEIPEQGEAVDPLELSDEARVAAEAIEELRPEQREVLKLALVEGRTHVQIADLTKLPLGTVKSHARRGLERVRGLLQANREGNLGRAGS